MCLYGSYIHIPHTYLGSSDFSHSEVVKYVNCEKSDFRRIPSPSLFLRQSRCSPVFLAVKCHFSKGNSQTD